MAEKSSKTPERCMSAEEFIKRTSPRSVEPAIQEPEAESEAEAEAEPKVKRELLFPTLSVPQEEEAPSSSAVPASTKDEASKKSVGRASKKCGGGGMKIFSSVVRTYLEAWKFGNEHLLDTNVAEELGLPVNFFVMHRTELNFPATLTSKHRHVVHEICEELNLKHVSSGTVAERAISVFKEERAQGHNLSRAVYGGVHYEDGVEKQQHEAYLRRASPTEWEEVRTAIASKDDVLDRLHLYESRAFNLESLAGVPPLAAENIVLVATEEQLAQAASHLQRGERLGFDAEWHSYRSYFGVTCLLQLTCGDGTVFVIDCLACWGVMKQHLGPLFENPQIVKVGLAVQQDVQYLLRDFGIVTRGVFDLQIAMKFTEQTSNMGYASVLALCGCDPTVLTKIEMGKTNVRVSDWRRRPLTAEMLEYASSDCYYLLPCHDILAHRLAQIWGLQGAVTGSESLVHDALRVALDKAIFKVTDWRKNKGYCAMREVMKETQKKGRNRHVWRKKKYSGQPGFSTVNERVLEALYAYREYEAWKHDESLNFIASADLLFHLSWKLPTTPQAICDLISTASLSFPERDLDNTRLPPHHPLYGRDPTAEAQEAACAPWAAIIKSTLYTMSNEEAEAHQERGAYWGPGVMWGVVGVGSILFMVLGTRRNY